MLTTDAYAFLNIENPMCAWAAYRGILVCAPDNPGFVSVWTASLLHANDLRKITFEDEIERVRVAQFPDRISRLRGMFCFLDRRETERVKSWGGHFQPKYLAELNLGESGCRRDRLDANWITFAARDAAGSSTDRSWIPEYWSGEPYPKEEPMWETLVDGRMIVLGTAIRQRAHGNIKSEFSESLTLLEIARQAAWVGSDFGSITAFLRNDKKEISLEYLMNWLDADNPDFLKKLEELKNGGHPINYADIKSNIERNSFGHTPDLRSYGFRRTIKHAAS